LLALALGLLVLYLWFRRHDPRYPPCPARPWPVFGHILMMERNPRRQFRQWRKECGDIFSLYMGRHLVIFLNGYDVIQEATVKRGDDFSDRAPIYMNEALDGLDAGIVAASGDLWKETKALSISILRDFGFGKNMLVQKVCEEAQCLNEKIASLRGKPFKIHSLAAWGVSNAMCSIIVGHRFDYQDPMFQRLVFIMEHNFPLLYGTTILNFVPFLRWLPGDVFSAKIIFKLFREFIAIFSTEYVKKCEDGSPEALESFISRFYDEMKKRQASGEKTHLDRRGLVKCIFDLFAGATETTSSTISWCMLYILNHPEVEEKIYREIDSVIGLERAPTLLDKANMPYLSAFILETQRLSSLVPLGIPRLLHKDVTFRGFLLPKGSQVIMNNDSIHHDESWGPDADKFRPERFIGPDGKVTNPEKFAPFSMGRRVCMGEGLAKVELFIFLANLFQRFKFVPAEDGVVPPMKEVFGIVCTPVRYEMRAIDRRAH
ncbi:unnamed protein product, partial [Lymnaea stagnalis]